MLSAGHGCAWGQAGSLLWSFATTDPIPASPAIGPDGTIYFGSYDRMLHAVTPEGSNRWAFTLPTKGYAGIYASPAIGLNGTIYCGTEDGRLYALDPAKGNALWTFTVEGADDNNNPASIYSSPAVASDGTVYFGSYSTDLSFCFLYAVTNGVLKWRYQPSDGVFSSPVIGLDGTVYFGCDDGKLYALDPAGTLRWVFNTGNKAISASPAIGPDGKVYIGVGSAFNPRFYCVNPDGATNWVFTAANGIRSSAAIGNDGIVYFGSNDNSLYALNPNGTLKWAVSTGATNGASPALAADGTIYIGSDDGSVRAFDRQGSNVWTFAAGGAVSSSPAIGTNGAIYFGSADYHLYALSGTSGLATAPWPMFRHDLRHTGEYVVIANTAPVIESILVSSLGADVTWSSIPGRLYRLQYKSSLVDSEWSDLSGDVVASVSLATKRDMAVSDRQRFYRVVLLP
jgi:outer membrane protein assembly factor BamB